MKGLYKNQVRLIGRIQKQIQMFSTDPSKNELNKDVSRVTVNEDRIRQKLQNFNRNPELPMVNYNIKKPTQFYDSKNKNPTGEVFDFTETILSKKEYQLQVYGLGNGYFSVNEIWYPGSIICFPNQIFLWDVTTADDIKPHTLDIIDVIKPTPDYIIIGTGKDKQELDENIYQRFVDRGIRVDVIPTFQACSTFNVCNEDNLNIMAFLIPANL